MTAWASFLQGKRAGRGTLPALVITDGSIEALKWAALLFMTGDHVNKYLFNGTLPYLFEAGRLALPLFVIVLAYNLARPGVLERGAHRRTMLRLALFGAAACVPFISLGGVLWGWWPLNVMFTLLVATGILYLVERGQAVAGLAVFAVAGAVVEFWWPALTLAAAVWWYCKRPCWPAALLGLLACASLWFINGNLWALAALPLVIAASGVDLHVPRLRWAFYAYYPLHLAVLWLIRIPMSHAGYLFFI
ncbi:TraX family protein [Xanthomonas citri]|uniref:TraX family protein n=1 Tax=Xanthomonas citri TaxID=346 RepID=UPI0030DB1B4C